MRDEDFAWFIEKMGEADSRVDVPQSAIDYWRGKLPNRLLEYWRDEGWSSYAKGLFWTVNPSDYSELVEQWLENTPLVEIDKFHIIARTAFGELYACGEKTGCSLTISPSINYFFILKSDTKPKTEAHLDRNVSNFFSCMNKKDADLTDEDDVPLFERAVALHGPLAPNEMFGFAPALIVGGRYDLNNIKKYNLFVHLDLLYSLSPEPNIVGLNLDF